MNLSELSVSRLIELITHYSKDTSPLALPMIDRINLEIWSRETDDNLDAWNKSVEDDIGSLSERFA